MAFARRGAALSAIFETIRVAKFDGFCLVTHALEDALELRHGHMMMVRRIRQDLAVTLVPNSGH